jgi:nucleoid-associated protein YgaU
VIFHIFSHSISTRFYGTLERAREIMEFNGIGDESSLRPGKKLKIKPRMKEETEFF